MEKRSMFFADDQISVWIVGVGGVCTIIGGGVAWLWAALMSKRKTTIGEWRDIAERERDMRYRAESRNSNLEASFRRMFTFYCDARSGRIDLYALLLLQEGVRKRQNERLEKANLPTEDGFVMPPKPTDKLEDAEFLVNTVAQSKIAADSVATPTLAVKVGEGK